MYNLELSEKLKLWQYFVDTHAEGELRVALQEAPPVEVAEFLVSQSIHSCVKLLSYTDLKLRAEIFSHLPRLNQLKLYQTVPRRTFAEMFMQMDSDSRADFYLALADAQKVQLLPLLPKEVKIDVMALSAHKPDTAGAIMETNFSVIEQHLTIKEAIEKIRREAPSRKLMHYIYVVDENMRLKGYVSLKDLVLEDPRRSVDGVMRRNYPSRRVHDTRESVAKEVQKYDLITIPILNEADQLVGVVSCDDAMDVIRAAATEDMERFGGVVSQGDGEDYLQISSIKHFRQRILWVSGLLVVGSISTWIMHGYASLLEKLAVLACYTGQINSAGGNAGSQSAALVIRALALGQISLQDWLKILWKELKIALMSGSVLFFLAFCYVFILSNTAIPVPFAPYLLAGVIALSLSMQVVSSTLIGAALPLLFKFLGWDPALAASSAIATLVDITGIVIYFSISHLLLLHRAAI